MPALPNYKEQIHYELFDTLIRGVGTSTVGTKQKLFSATNIGSPQLTNMQEGGRMSSDEIFLVLSLRFYVQFATAILHRYIEDGLFFTFTVGNKDMLGAIPILLAPGGGGMSGYDVNASAHVITNGSPGWPSILRLAKPVKIEKGQHFEVQAEFYDFGSYDGGITPALGVLNTLNADIGLKIVKCFLGGILARNVQ